MTGKQFYNKDEQSLLEQEKKNRDLRVLAFEDESTSDTQEDTFEEESEDVFNLVLGSNGVTSNQQEQGNRNNGLFSGLFNREEIELEEQKKLKSEFSIYADHKIELISQGINIGTVDDKKTPTKEEQKKKFMSKRDSFLKKMNRSRRSFWGTNRYYRLLRKWFPDYTQVISHKVSAIKISIEESINTINENISSVIDTLKEAIILADSDIGGASQLLKTAEKYLYDASQHKENAINTLDGFEKDESQDLLTKYDTVLDKYQELIIIIQLNVQGIGSDKSKFESTILKLTQQKSTLKDFNVKVKETSDVLELVSLQNEEFLDLISSTEKIIEDAKGLERTTSGLEETTMQSELDSHEKSISTLDTELEELTGGVSKVYWGKGVYYGEEVDALYIVAKDYSSARKYSHTINHDDFWFFVNKETGWTSGIQQKDAVNKYYQLNPISHIDLYELVKYSNYYQIETPDHKYPYTIDFLQELHKNQAEDFRELVEEIQFRLFDTSNVIGFGLLTPETKEKIKESNELIIPEKVTLERPENQKIKFTDFNKVGIVFDKNTGANLRYLPNTSEESLIKNLAFNTRVYIQSKNDELGWYFVTTESGEEGYVAQQLIKTNLPNSDARLYLIKKGDTALGLALRFYSSYSGESIGEVQYLAADYRNYVDKLVQYNKDTPGISYKGGKEWDDAQLKAGFLIWVPSPMTMYEMIRNTSTFDLHGKSAYVTLAQDAFDYMPQNLLIHTLLEKWREIPAEDINNSLQEVDEFALGILKKLRMSDMEWLDAFLALASPGAFVSMKFLAFMREFTIGYIEYLNSLDAETRVKSMERFLFSYTQIDYFIGIFQGIGNGIVDWFKDIWAIFEGIYDFITDLPEYYEQIKEAFGDASDFVIKLIEFLKDPSSAGSISDFLKNFNPLDIFTLIDAGIEKAGQSAGKWAAKEIVGFLNLSPIALGKKVGWLIGYLIPEILLAVFSAGIGTAIKIGVQAFIKGLRLILKIISKAVKATLKILKTALGAIKDALKFVKSMAAFFAKKGKSKMGPFFESLEELLKKFKEFLKRKQITQKLKFDPKTATAKQKGNFGEIVSDTNLKEKHNLKRIGNEPPKTIDDKIKKGIDGIYENPNSPPKYIINEAKYGKSKLGKTKDGKQMSDDWIKGSDRLEDMVGLTEAKKIRDALKKGEVHRVLSKIDETGKVTTKKLDSKGNIIGDWP